MRVRLPLCAEPPSAELTQSLPTVHSKGSFIYLQLWAHGRAADPKQLQADGDFDVVSASDIPFEGGATPRPLTEAEIKDYVRDYAFTAKRFVEEAGGDGVEVSCSSFSYARTPLPISHFPLPFFPSSH